MNFGIRTFEASDYEGVAEIANAIYPKLKMAADEWRNEDRVFEGSHFIHRRYVALDLSIGKIVGFGSISHMPLSFQPQKFRMQILVKPDFRKCGIGSAIFERFVTD
ncbi:MAG: GNAT family N-acetyltransferase [Armatimonadota bacterium]|nr:GNAT family N-acetyltransferase [Armatimonadota bacterium]